MIRWFACVWAAAKHEVRHVFSHRVELAAAVLVPLFWCAVLAVAFGTGTLSGLPVGFVDLDQSTSSRTVKTALASIPSIRLVPFENSLEADRALRNTETFATVTLPKDFEVDRKRGEGSPVVLDLNKSWYAVGTLLEVDVKTALSAAAVEGAAVKLTQRGGTFLENMRHLRLTLPDVYFLGNAAFNFVAYLLPTFIPGVMALGALLAFVTMITREWRDHGVGALLQGSGGSASAAIVGKLVPWTLFWMLAASVWVAGFAGAWGHAGPLILWFIAAWLLILAMAGLAVFASALSPTWVIALSASICLIAPTFPFTGFSFPLDAMTEGAKVFGFLLPLTHFIEAQGQIWVLGSPLDEVARTLLTLALFPAVLLAAGLPLYSMKLYRLERREIEDSNDAPAGELVQRPWTGFWKAFALTLKHAFVSRDTIAILGGAVAFYLIFYGWPYERQQIEGIPTAVVDLDGSPVSRDLIEELEAAAAADIQVVTADEAEGLDLFKRGKVAALITIPHDYGKSLARAENSTVHLLGSAAYPVKARAVQGALSSIIADTEAKLALSSVLATGIPPETAKAMQIANPSLKVVYRFNEISGYGNYTVPAVGPVIIQAVMLMGIGMSAGAWLCARRRPDFVADAVERPWCEGVGMLFAFWTIAFGWFLYMEGFGFAFGEYGAMRNPEAVILTGMCYAAAVVAFGVAVVTLVRPYAWTAPATVVMSAPALLISGAVWPAENIHPFASSLAQLIPSTPAIFASVAAAQDGAATQDVLPHCLHLIVLAAIYSTFALLKLRTLKETPQARLSTPACHS